MNVSIGSHCWRFIHAFVCCPLYKETMTFTNSYDVGYEVRGGGGERKRERATEVKINTGRVGERKFRGYSKRYFFRGEKEHYFLGSP
jgi:hypothetical protein